MDQRQRSGDSDRPDARVWPLIVLGAMFCLGCTVTFNNFDARVRNDSGKPVLVEYSGETDGADRERCTVLLPSGGTLVRHVQGLEVHAAVRVQRPDDAWELVEFQQGLSDVIIADHAGGVTIERRPPEPRP